MGSTSKTKTFARLIPPLAAALFSAAAAAQEPACPFYENRSGLCGYYQSEVSPARAFLETVENRGKRSSHRRQPVILDVRSTPEYKAGHP